MDRTEERKIKARARAKLWAAKNPERYRANQKRWHAENQEKRRTYDAEYRAKHRDEFNANRREARKQNPEHFREQKRRSNRRHPGNAAAQVARAKSKKPDHYRKKSAEYRNKNRARLDHQKAEWRKKNPERAKQIHDAAAHNRRVREIAAGKISADDVKRIRAASICAACGNSHPRMEIDHIVALSRGGPNHLANLQLLCRPCNRSKHDKDHIEWLQERTQATV